MGFSLADVPQDAARSLHGTMALGPAGLAIGSTTSKVTLGTTTPYIVDGVFCSKSAAADVWTLPATVDYIAPGSAAPPVKVSSAFGAATDTVDSTRYFFLGLNAAGTAYTYMSKAPSAAQASQDDTLLPDFDAGVCILGIVKVTIAAGYVFTPGTTALNAAHVTTTYTNVAMVPSTLP